MTDVLSPNSLRVSVAPALKRLREGEDTRKLWSRDDHYGRRLSQGLWRKEMVPR